MTASNWATRSTAQMAVEDHGDSTLDDPSTLDHFVTWMQGSLNLRGGDRTASNPICEVQVDIEDYAESHSGRLHLPVQSQLKSARITSPEGSPRVDQAAYDLSPVSDSLQPEIASEGPHTGSSVKSFRNASPSRVISDVQQEPHQNFPPAWSTPSVNKLDIDPVQNQIKTPTQVRVMETLTQRSVAPTVEDGSIEYADTATPLLPLSEHEISSAKMRGFTVSTTETTEAEETSYTGTAVARAPVPQHISATQNETNETEPSNVSDNLMVGYSPMAFYDYQQQHYKQLAEQRIRSHLSNKQSTDPDVDIGNLQQSRRPSEGLNPRAERWTPAEAPKASVDPMPLMADKKEFSPTEKTQASGHEPFPATRIVGANSIRSDAIDEAHPEDASEGGADLSHMLSVIQSRVGAAIDPTVDQRTNTEGGGTSAGNTHSLHIQDIHQFENCISNTHASAQRLESSSTNVASQQQPRPSPERQESMRMEQRTVIMTKLPEDSDYTFVQSLIHGATIENIHLNEKDCTARVKFTNSEDARKYVEGYPQGIRVKHNRKLHVIVIKISDDRCVEDPLLQAYLSCGATRAVQVDDVDEDLTMGALFKLTQASGTREVETILDTYRRSSRDVVFRFANIKDAVSFRGQLGRDKSWKAGNPCFTDDPCYEATAPRQT